MVVQLLLATFLSVWLPSAHGQLPSVSDPTVQAAERAQRDQQERLQQDLQSARATSTPGSHLAVAVPARRERSVDEFKRPIHTLQLEGADHLDAGFRADLQQRFTGELGVSDVEALLTELTRYYVLRGYATSRAYLPEQDLTTGVLKVIVVEGRIERFGGAKVAANVFPTRPGDLLNLRRIEQGLDNLNRLQSNHATLDLQPGSVAGDSVVAINNEVGRRWHVSASIDNSGAADTGRTQGSLTVGLDNLLGWADYLSVTHRRSIPYETDRRASQSTSASYTLPWGWNAFTIGGSYSSYAMTYFAPSGTALPFDGNSTSAFVSADRLLFRDRQSQLTASASLNWRSSKNYILGRLIGVSSRDTSSVELALGYNRAQWGGSLSARLGVTVGVPLFGSLSDPAGLPAYAPRAEYQKAIFNLGYSRSFTIAERQLLVSSSLNGQLTKDVLYGTDQLTAGSQYAVRGFDANNPTGDWGFVWRNDVSMPFRLKNPLGARFGADLGVRPYLGIDVGRVWSNVNGLPDRFVPPEGGLAGGAVGVALSVGSVRADLSYHQSFDRPAGVPKEDGRFYARASFSF